MNKADREQALTLELLQAVDEQNDVTQRSLADRLGVALGLANSYLKRCVRKGLIKTRQVPPNRFLYYLTPKGFREKSRLTVQYLSDSLHIYRRASESYTRLYRQVARDGRQAVVLYGVSELAEIALIRAREFGIQVRGVYDPTVQQPVFLRLPVWPDLAEVPAHDALVFTVLAQPEEMYARLRRDCAADAVILVPEFLAFVQTAPRRGGA